MPTKETAAQLSLFPRRDTLQEVVEEGIASLPITTENELMALLYLHQNTLIKQLKGESHARCTPG